MVYLRKFGLVWQAESLVGVPRVRSHRAQENHPGGRGKTIPSSYSASGGQMLYSVLWIRIRIRIRMDPHQFGNLDPHPDPHLHQIKIWIRIRIRICIKLISWIRIRIRINLQMTSQKVLKMSLFEHFFKDLSLYLEHQGEKSDPNPHPDPHQIHVDPQNWLK
jgi:hypothetical protein